MAIEVVPYSDAWPDQFERIARELGTVLSGLPKISIEHVGSTSVPGLAAKPIIDVDVMVARPEMGPVLASLVSIGYTHAGDLGLTDREALDAPDDDPRRHVYICVAGTLQPRNHLAVRAALRSNADLRDRYGAVKLSLAADPTMTINRYVAGKSEILQEILALSDLSDAEKLAILRLNAES